MPGMATLCCMCGKEINEQPDRVRRGYCSDECWETWVEEHKDDAIMAPYVPLQVTHLDCWHLEEVKSSTACKHGEQDCEVCGTSSRRDYKHKTVGGNGLIGRIKGT